MNGYQAAAYSKIFLVAFSAALADAYYVSPTLADSRSSRSLNSRSALVRLCSGMLTYGSGIPTSAEAVLT